MIGEQDSKIKCARLLLGKMPMRNNGERVRQIWERPQTTCKSDLSEGKGERAWAAMFWPAMRSMEGLARALRNPGAS